MKITDILVYFISAEREHEIRRGMTQDGIWYRIHGISILWYVPAILRPRHSSEEGSTRLSRKN